MTPGHLILAALVVLFAGCALWMACMGEVRKGLRDPEQDPAVLLPYTYRPGLPGAYSRIPPRPVSAPVHPECLDESQVAQDANLLIAAATAMCRRDAEIQANAALMDEYATQFPMKIRPRLVEQADTDINPLTGDSHDR